MATLYPFPGPDHAPGRELHDPHLRGTVVCALRQLDRDERLALSLFIQENLAEEEACRVMGLEPPAVRRLHDHALGQVRAAVGQRGRSMDPSAHGRPADRPSGATVLVEGDYEALLAQLAWLRQENERLSHELAEVRATSAAAETSQAGSSLLQYTLEVLCTLLTPRRGQALAPGLPDGAPAGVGPLQLALERPALERAWQGEAVRLTTRYEAVLWLPIRQGEQVAAVLCLRRTPAEPFTSTEQAVGEALAPLVIGALQTGHRRFELGADHEAQAALRGALAAAMRGGGGRVAAQARDAERLAERFGLGAAERWAVRLAAILHDIGTVDLAEDLMHREGRLSAAELAQLREHPAFGAAIVGQLPGLEAVAPLVLAHHERPDGTGYPHGLAGGAIPLGARVVAVVDAFHAMTNPRTGRRRRSTMEALAELRACAGSQFDPWVVEEFCRLVGADSGDGEYVASV